MGGKEIFVKAISESGFDVGGLARLLSLIEEAFSRAYDVLKVDVQDKNLPKGASPTLVSANDKSIAFSCTTKGSAGLNADLLYNIMTRRLSPEKGNRGITVSKDAETITIKLDKPFHVASQRKWGKEEERAFVEEAIAVYVRDKESRDPEEFILNKSFLDLVYAHGLYSLLLKLRNTKAILENPGENKPRIENSLSIKPLKNHSRQNKELVEECLAAPNLK